MYVVANQRLAFKNKLADDEIHSKRNLCQKIGGWQNLIEASFCEFNFINLNKIEIGCNVVIWVNAVVVKNVAEANIVRGFKNNRNK